MPKTIEKRLTQEIAAEVLRGRGVPLFRPDVFKPLVYNGEDLQYAVVAGIELSGPKANSGQRRKFFITATLRGEVTDIGEIVPHGNTF